MRNSGLGIFPSSKSNLAKFNKAKRKFFVVFVGDNFHGKIVSFGICWRIDFVQEAFKFYVDKILRIFDPSLSVGSLFIEAYVLT